MIEAPARADGDGLLPWGIHAVAGGRYAQDVCDRSFARPCMSLRLLPETYVPVRQRSPRPGPRPNAGGSYCQSPGSFGALNPVAGTMAPSDALAAYSIPANTGAYGKIVAIVDMPDSHIYQDLSTYRSHYNLPTLPQCASGFPDGKTPCFAQVDELGRTPNVTATDCAGTSGETALDVEMVSAVCPDCSIVLVQLTLADMTYGPGDGDFLQAAQTAATLGAIATSISYGGPEAAGHDNTGYTTPGHLVFASSGDESYLDIQYGASLSPQFPASSPDVVGVGGTTLVPLGGSTYAEKVWNDTQYPQGQATTSGCSTEFPAPAFQTAFLATHPGAFGACTNRDSVDVSAAAEFQSNTGDGISIYDSGEGGWLSELGTSAASPMVAAIFTRLGVAEAVSNDLGFLYKNIAAFKVVPSGNLDGTQTCTDPVQCNADGGTSWNGPTGVGTPNGAKLVPLGTPNVSSSSSGGGADAGEDSGTVVDSGSGSGSGGGADSGSGKDSGAGNEADSGSGGADGGSGGGGSSKSGCGCATAGSSSSALDALGLLAMGAGALVIARRRRSRA